MSRTLTAALFVLGLVALVLATGKPAPAFEVELQRYQQALVHVCRTGVTPELIRLYEEVVKAIDAARYGGGRASNFWGPRPPDLAYQDCFQSPGWGQ